MGAGKPEEIGSGEGHEVEYVERSSDPTPTSPSEGKIKYKQLTLCSCCDAAKVHIFPDDKKKKPGRPKGSGKGKPRANTNVKKEDFDNQIGDLSQQISAIATLVKDSLVPSTSAPAAEKQTAATLDDKKKGKGKGKKRKHAGIFYYFTSIHCLIY